MLPESPSEAVSRFRDDVDDVVHYAESWIDFAGFVLYGILRSRCWRGSIRRSRRWYARRCSSMSLVMRKLSPVIRSYRRKMREATARVTDAIGEAFAAVQAIKAAGREDSMTAHFRSLGEERRRRALADVLLTEMIRGINNGLVFVGIGFMLTMAASRIRTGEFTVGDLAIFIQLLPRVTNVLTFVGGDVLAQHRRVRVATDRMEHLMVDAPPGKMVEHQPLDTDRAGPRVRASGARGRVARNAARAGTELPVSEFGGGDRGCKLRA